MTTYQAGGNGAVDKALAHVSCAPESAHQCWDFPNKDTNGRVLLAGINLIADKAHHMGYTSCHIRLVRDKSLGTLRVYVGASHIQERTYPRPKQHHRPPPTGNNFIDSDLVPWLDSKTIDGKLVIDEDALSYTFWFINKARLYPGITPPWPQDVTITEQHDHLMQLIRQATLPLGYGAKVSLHASLVSEQHYHVELTLIPLPVHE